MNPDPAEIHVTVNAKDRRPAYPVNAMEWIALRLGHPVPVGRMLDRLNLIVCFCALAYVVGWTVMFSAVGLDLAPKGWSPARVLAVSLGWVFFMMLMPVLGGLRFATVTLLTKNAEHLARMTEAQFHQRVADAVTAALDAHFAERSQPPPTIQ